MLNEVLQYLNPREGETIVDGTVGLGGHAQAILEKIGPTGKLIAVDRDRQSLEVARKNLSSAKNCEFVHDDYRNIDQILQKLSVAQVDGILLDLGISSFQMDNPERGFSIRSEGPLDMRMDQDSEMSALDLINSLSERELDAILKDYGQERFHARIARGLINARSRGSIATTKDLAEVVLRSIPYYPRREKIHPATRTFQALRIAVNRELEGLEVALNKSISILKPGGRIAVIAFHSLEDKVVKEKFRDWRKLGTVKLITKKPLRPTEEETKNNSRARSARLRIAERD